MPARHSVQTRQRHSRALLTAAQWVKAMAAATSDRVVAEGTNHLRYLGIYFDRMLTVTDNTWKQQHWSARNAYQSQRAIAAKILNNATYFFLLYQSVMLISVSGQGIGVATTAQTQLLKLDKSTERGNESYTGSHQGHNQWDHAVHVS